MLVEKSAVSCDEVNRIQLQLLDWGHACTAREWVGDIRDPAYARLYYICTGDPYILFAGHQLPLQPGWWYLLPGGFSFRHACRSRMEQLYFHIQLVDDTGVNLLRRTDLSIQQISDRLGFCDPCYFSRRFHKRYGLSPKQYRKHSLI